MIKLVKLVIVTLAVTIATIQVDFPRAAAATPMGSSAIAVCPIANSSTNSPPDRQQVAIAKCTIKRYRRPRVRD
jgi:hypothetical protein